MNSFSSILTPSFVSLQISPRRWTTERWSTSSSKACLPPSKSFKSTFGTLLTQNALTFHIWKRTFKRKNSANSISSQQNGQCSSAVNNSNSSSVNSITGRLLKTNAANHDSPKVTTIGNITTTTATTLSSIHTVVVEDMLSSIVASKKSTNCSRTST